MKVQSGLRLGTNQMFCAVSVPDQFDIQKMYIQSISCEVMRGGEINLK